MPAESAGFSYDPEVGPGWWTMAPTRFLRARGLTPTAKLLYLVLCSYAMQKTAAWPGQDRLAEDCDVTRPTLRAALRQLIAVGLVEQRRRGQGLTNLYHLHKVPVESVREGKNLAFRAEGKNLADRKASRLPTSAQESSPKESVSQETAHKNGSGVSLHTFKAQIKRDRPDLSRAAVAQLVTDWQASGATDWLDWWKERRNWY